MKRYPTAKKPYKVGGFGVCVRQGVAYFDLKMKESVQGWRSKWFYMRDEKRAGQKFGLAPFLDAPVVKKKSWKYATTEAEDQEADQLLKSISILLSQKRKELSRTSIYSLFIKRRVQPLQHRIHPMWEYSGVNDPTRCQAIDLSPENVKLTARRFSFVKKEDENTFEVEPAVTPYGEDNPLPEVSLRYTKQTNFLHMRLLNETLL